MYAYVPTLLGTGTPQKTNLGQDTQWVRSVVSKSCPQGKCPQPTDSNQGSFTLPPPRKMGIKNVCPLQPWWLTVWVLWDLVLQMQPLPVPGLWGRRISWWNRNQRGPSSRFCLEAEAHQAPACKQIRGATSSFNLTSTSAKPQRVNLNHDQTSSCHKIINGKAHAGQQFGGFSFCP